ncbi:hypothetical protein [Rubripirellula lacrimiformis]|uniref:hypothetical protein n=1 Tax=Rubripirellula lacrimiformis TaxID=1930273 RepID=UPI001C54C400|nr:hypothetical protein [Rubripirellula lacrimiformis]
MSRTNGITIPIKSNNPNSPPVVPTQPSVRPTSATVDIQYFAGTAENGQSEIRVVVEWPPKGNSSINGESTLTEAKSASIDFESVRNFLEGTGRFRVDSAEQFYGPATGDGQPSDDRYTVDVKLFIDGPNPDARLSTTFPYQERKLLFDLAQRVWPGIA